MERKVETRASRFDNIHITCIQINTSTKSVHTSITFEVKPQNMLDRTE